jgi:hypothetical protein
VLHPIMLKMDGFIFASDEGEGTGGNTKLIH